MPDEKAQHPLDGEMGLAGIGRAENGDVACGKTSGIHEPVIGLRWGIESRAASGAYLPSGDGE